MTGQTMNNDATMAGGERSLLTGRYRIVRQLGTGGMGSVWLVQDTQLDEKLFAVKMLPSILVSNKRAYRQLKDEALVAMRLVHPNIVQIRAFEENDGNPFLLMDYIDGQTLDDYLADHEKLTEDETIRILRPIADALDFAHKQGVVHRDVKPSNVMIGKDGTSFVLDFGIAREIQETMTRVTGKVSSGTLMYMSPEQLMGDVVKPAQDVYSFAAMVYECLAGKAPFSTGQIEYQITTKAPEPLPSHIAIRDEVMSGLAKKPAERPTTCVAILDVGRMDARSSGAGVNQREDATRSHNRATSGDLHEAFLRVMEKAGINFSGQKDRLVLNSSLSPTEKASIKKYGPTSDYIVVAEVINTKIKQCDSPFVQIYDGTEYYPALCNASNCADGMNTALAKNGAWLYNFDAGGHPNPIHDILVEKKARGQLCGNYELGLSNVPTGLISFPSELTPGIPVRDAFKYIERTKKGADYFESHIGYCLGETAPDMKHKKHGTTYEEGGCVVCLLSDPVARMHDVEDFTPTITISPKTRTICRLSLIGNFDSEDAAGKAMSNLIYAIKTRYKTEFDRLPGSSKWVMRGNPNGHEWVVQATNESAIGFGYRVEAIMTDPQLEALILTEASEEDQNG